ncbi:MAG TPA: hypothetical protein PK307_17675 [Spirochaetota bacterium]|nr:hypothetical protein [Spirochaetota bacterium]HOD14494.1 hypothetical protein [Spirochaetota bacterium]HPG50489.1 hypothetical protein [Spirochaetota bacterium]HPN11846.1 hypothetical protein [Spirochaetota bacterium]HQL84032.1 hypothetical protein [Spirochaetota bacterium]
MRFSLILYGFYALMRFTALHDTVFRARIAEKDFSLTIRTDDGSRARSYACRGGTVSSRRGQAPDAEFSLIWKDAATGFRYLSAMKPSALARAITGGDLKLAGEALAVSRFLETFRIMMAEYRNN